MRQKLKVTLVSSLLLSACSAYAATLPVQHYASSTTVEEPLSIAGNALGILATNANFPSNKTPTSVILASPSIDVSVDLSSLADRPAAAVYATAGTHLSLGNANTRNIDISIINRSAGNPKAQIIGVWAQNFLWGSNNVMGVAPANISITSENLIVNVNSEVEGPEGTTYGILVQNIASESDPDKRSTVEINSKNTLVNVTAKGESGGLAVFSHGVLKVNGNLEVNAGNAIITRGNSIIRINESGKNQVVLNGDIKYSYDGESSGTPVESDVLVNLTGNNSQWTGNVKTGWDSSSPSNSPIPDDLIVKEFKLVLADGAQWNPSVVSQVDEQNKGLKAIPVNNLTFSDGVINLTKAQDQKVEIEKLQGTGGIVNVAAATDGTTISSAQLKADAVEGAPHFTVNAVGLTSDEIKNQKEAMESFYANALDLADGSNATATLNVAEGAVAGALTAKVAKDGSVVVEEAQNTVNSSLIDIAASNYLFFRSQMNDVSARLGDLRSMPKTAGAWVRYYGGKNKYSSGNMSEKYNTVQLGGDGFISDNFYLGGTFSYTHGDGDLRNGSTDDKNFNFGIYGGWLGDSGQFVDVIIKRHRVKSEFSLYNTMGRNSGSFHNWGTSASVEAGWRLQCPDTGFYVEPQAELQFGRLDSVDYKTSKGVKVEQDGIDSFVGRAGVAVGYTFPENKGNAYAKASVLHDWKGEVKSTFSSNGASRTYRDDLGGTWGEFAVGGTFNPTKNISAYGQVKTSAGSPVRNPWQVSVGVRYSF